MNFKKPTYIKIVLTALCCALLVLTLCACGLFAGQRAVQNVDVSAVSGLSIGDGESIYEAEAGKEFSLKCDWHNATVIAPTVKWFIAAGNAQKTEISDKADKAELKYTLDDINDTVYSFSATVNGVECKAPLRVKVKAAELSNPTITSTTHTIVQGEIRQDIVSGPTDIGLHASWNEEHFSADTAVNVAWFADGVLKHSGANQRDFVFEVANIDTPCEITLRCELSYAGLAVPKASQIKLCFIAVYQPVSQVVIQAEQTARVNKIGDSTYMIASASGTEISLGAQVLPSSTDLSSECEWSVTNYSGTTVLQSKARNVQATLSHGKNVIKATVDNVESRHIIVYALSDAEYKSRESYIKDTFVWEGNVQDHYINNQQDLNMLVGYICSLHRTAANADDPAAHHMYLAPADWKDGNSVSDKLREAVGTASSVGVDESGRFSFSYSIESIWLHPTTDFGEPNGAITPQYNVEQANCYVRYKTQAQSRESLPIDTAQPLAVADSNALYRALSWGYRPLFEANANGLRLAALYEKARNVLLSYVSDDMSDIEKVSVIYDWIVDAVEYDYTAADSGNTDVNAFYLEGVFDDMRAVCDGKSKAFTLLCGMEGIKSLRIVGMAGSDGKQSGHAWNKVLVDADGDGVREWYAVDTTWGDMGFSNQGAFGTKTEYLSYAYFLVDDAFISQTHSSDYPQPSATAKYDAFANTYVTVNNERVSFEVTSAEQLSKLVEFSRQNGSCYLNVKMKIDTPQSLPINFSMMRVTNLDSVYYIKYGF